MVLMVRRLWRCVDGGDSRKLGCVVTLVCVVVLVIVYVTDDNAVSAFHFGCVKKSTNRIASWVGGFALRHNAAARLSSRTNITSSSPQLQHNHSSYNYHTNNASIQPIATKPTSTESTISQCNNNNTSKTTSNTNEQHNTATLLTYYNPTICNTTTLYCLNLSTSKFLAWVQHKLNITTSSTTTTTTTNTSILVVTKQLIRFDQPGIRDRVRLLWKQGLLLSDRTEPLATYISDMEQKQQQHPSLVIHDNTNNYNNTIQKRGGFRDLLSLYADRLASIVYDECHDSATTNTNNMGLYQWMEQEYGIQKVQNLSLSSCSTTTTQQQQILELQLFLDWFRSRFPYYYDRCDVCGASQRDKSSTTTTTTTQQQTSNDETTTTSTANIGTVEDEEEDDNTKGSFIGYVYPNREELDGKASRTELYLCKQCKSLTRFPRYNSASFIVRKQKGRCGEYSMLLYRMLRVLGYETRWVVDWADHVWCEVLLLHKKWVHLDPCEAAVDKPYLYQEWGKEQTYIIAFHAPPIRTTLVHTTNKQQQQQQLIVDVTRSYTSDSHATITKRREEPETHIESSLVEVQSSLWEKLNSVVIASSK